MTTKKTKRKTESASVTEYINQSLGDTRVVGRNLYTEEMLNDFEKLAKYYVDSINTFLDSAVGIANTSKELQQGNEKYKNELIAANSKFVDGITECKTLTEAALTQGELAKSCMDNNLGYMMNFGEFVKDIHTKMLETFNNNYAHATAKIKDSCHIYGDL